MIIFLSSSGLFNSCWCWSTVYSRGVANAVVLLDPDPARKKNAETIYPGLVGTGLIIHILFFLFALYRSRKGRSLLRRSEKVKTQEFWDIHKPKVSSQGVSLNVSGYEMGDRVRVSELERVPLVYGFLGIGLLVVWRSWMDCTILLPKSVSLTIFMCFIFSYSSADVVRRKDWEDGVDSIWLSQKGIFRINPKILVSATLFHHQ